MVEAGILVFRIAIDDVGVSRIGNHEARLAAAGGVPIAGSNHPVIIEAGHREVGIVLLSAIDPVGKAHVRGHVIELTGGLVFLG